MTDKQVVSNKELCSYCHAGELDRFSSSQTECPSCELTKNEWEGKNWNGIIGNDLSA